MEDLKLLRLRKHLAVARRGLSSAGRCYIDLGRDMVGRMAMEVAAVGRVVVGDRSQTWEASSERGQAVSNGVAPTVNKSKKFLT